ncbi:MAG: hypothetical protein JWL84_4496 [Rhodospirillales bacterium]|nr:hypothetical protein [Rhodospirillales bacterium]
MESAELLAKAAKCRRLADSISGASDPAIQVLLSIAEEFEARAAAHPPGSEADRRGELRY